MGDINRPDSIDTTLLSSEPLSYLPNPDIGDWFLEEIRNREKLILDMGGEPVKLLKRRWEGTKCTVCYDEVRRQAESDCLTCYGTGIVGGYYPQINITVSLVNPATRTLVIQDHGVKREVTPRCWMQWEPTIQGKDLIVTRQNARLWIQNVTPTLWKGLVIHQNFDTEVIEHSNIIYKIPITL